MRESKNIKICHVANTDMVVRFLLLDQLKFLQDEGYAVLAVCPKGPLIKDVEKEGIRVKAINFKRKIALIAHLVTLFKLFFYFKKEKFDIVHTHTPVPGFLGQIAAKMAGIPIIINTLHGFYFHKDTPLLKRKFYILIEKVAAKCSDLIFSQNKEDINTAIKEKICSSQKIKYLGNGINLQRFNPQRFSEEFIFQKKKNLGINPNLKIIGIVGRLVKEKGYLDLFEAFKKVLERFPETLLLSIGSPEPEKRDAIQPEIVKNYGIEKNVLFLGQRTDVDEIYPIMDIFVLPSWREGFPRTIIEAAAMGKPIIATDIRGCRETVENSKTGVLVPQKNPEKLAEAMIYLLKNPKNAEKMAGAAREKAEKTFDEKEIFNRIRKEYIKLIEIKISKR